LSGIGPFFVSVLGNYGGLSGSSIGVEEFAPGSCTTFNRWGYAIQVYGTPAGSCPAPMGYTSVNTGGGTQGAGFIDSEAVTLTSAVTVTDFQVYAFNPGIGTGGVALYNDGGNKPGNLVTGTTFTPVANWNVV